MLNKKQPDTDGCRQQSDRQMHEQERLDAHEPGHADHDKSYCTVSDHRAHPRTPSRVHQANWQAMLHNKQIPRAKTKHDNLITVEPICEPAPSRQRKILTNSQRRNIADAPPREIARTCVVDRMTPAPSVVGCQRQCPEHATQPVVGGATPEEGTMTTIMLDHEQTNEEPSGRHSNDKGQTIPKAQSHPHRIPKSDKRTGRYN